MKKKVFPTIVGLNLALLVFVGVSGDLGERSWVTMLVCSLPVFPFLLPTLVLALACILMKKAFMAGFHVAGFGVAYMILIPFGVPPLPNPMNSNQIKPKAVRVLTFNVGHGEGDAPKIVETIIAQNPDAFCLQAVSTSVPDAPLAVLLNEKFPHYEQKRDGNMLVATRWPITAYQTRSLPNCPLDAPVQDLSFDWDGTPVRILNVQLNPVPVQSTLLKQPAAIPDLLDQAASVRAEQTKELLRLVPGEPPIVCGDFNFSPRGANYREIRKIMLDAFVEAGEGFGLTFPGYFPLDRYDYVWLAYGWRCTRSWIPRDPRLARFPLVAEAVPFTPPSP